MNPRNEVLLLAMAMVGCTATIVQEAHAVSVPVADSSFETPVDATAEVPDGPGYWNFPFCCGSESGTYTPDSPVYGNQDGDYLGYMYQTAGGGFSALYQDAARIQEGTYTLTVGAAHEPDAEPTTAPFSINFEATGFGAGTVLLGENPFAVGALNSSTLTDISASVTIPSGSVEIGRNLRLVLVTYGADAGSNPLDPRASYNMDNVRLDFTPASGPTVSVPVGQPSFDPLSWYNPYGEGGNAGIYRPESPPFANQEGDQLGYLTLRDYAGTYSALYQDTTTITEPGTYTLSVGVAHDPGLEPTTAPLFLNFESVGPDGSITLLSENEFPVGSANSAMLTDLSASVVIPPGSLDIGNTLRLVLVAAGADAGSGVGPDQRATYLLDNVRLEFAPAVPEPASLLLLTVATVLVVIQRRWQCRV